MDLESFELILKKLKGHGKYVYLHIKGEPMMHPEFIEILRLCEAYEMKVNLTTNGTFIGQYANELLSSKALRQISISLQSQENLDDEKGFRQYMKDVLRLVKDGSSVSDIIFELRLWNYEGSVSGHDMDKNEIALAMIMEELDVTAEDIEAIPQGKGTKLMANVYLSKSVEFQWPDMKLDVIGTEGTCYGLRQQVGILVNGDVVVCCLDAEGDVVLGNIFAEDFEAIVTSKRGVAIVEGFERREIVEPLCMRCGYRKRFD
jgi:MoaA/NifB/PqqE/SkfB family radical SAM enzyme